jgi:hypothetical protein
VEISEAVKAATSVVGVPKEKRAVQYGSLGYPPQNRQAGPVEPVEPLMAYRWRTRRVLPG